MKINKKVICFTLIVTMIVSVACLPPTLAKASGTALVANHNSATLSEVKAIPSKWIDSANQKLKIAYWHTSHGSQVTDGLKELKQLTSKKYNSLNIVEPSSMDLGSTNFNEVTREYMNAHHSINVVMWSWCGQLAGWIQMRFPHTLKK